jgi:small subunit ribosomal protein S6
MLKYETLFLATSEITDEEISSIERQLDKLLSEFKGKLSLFDKWGKYRLAYPVNKSDYGVYVLVRYEFDKGSNVPEFVKELDTFVKIKCNEFVMRYVSIKLAPKDGNTYVKPDPIESNRSTNVDKFLKENKMEGILESIENGGAVEDLNSEDIEA